MTPGHRASCRGGSLWSGETWLVLGFPVARSSGPQRQIPGDPPSGRGGRGGVGGLPWTSRLPGTGRRAGFWSVIPVPERGPWAGQRCVHGGQFPTDFPGDSDSEEPACHAGDEASVPGLGSSPGEGHSCPLGYSCLGNPLDRGAWGHSPWGHRVRCGGATDFFAVSLSRWRDFTKRPVAPGPRSAGGHVEGGYPRPQPGHCWFPPHFQPAGACAAGG